MEEAFDIQVGEVLEPVEQQTIQFYGKPLVVIRLPNGEPCVVLSSFCTNLQLATTGQISRIRRKKALESGLRYARINTSGGPQTQAVLTLRVVPGWLFGIDAGRVKPEMQAEVERYQAECVDVLYAWASTPHLEAPTGLVPDKPVEKPATPEQGASLGQWHIYFQQMAAFTEWQMSIETWRGGFESRLESLEAVVPMILERLPDETITPAHQNMVKYYVAQLVKATGKSYATIYSALDTAFQVPRYQELREDQWEQIEQWFKRQMPSQKLPSTQRTLFDQQEGDSE